MISSFQLLLATLALLAFVSQGANQFSDVIIEKIARQVNVQTQLCFVETVLEVKNEKDIPLSEFYIAIPSGSIETLKLLLIYDNYEGGSNYEYTIIDDLKIKNEYQATLYKIELDPPLRSGKTKSIKVKEVHWEKMHPYPKKITINVKLIYKLLTVIGRSKGHFRR